MDAQLRKGLLEFCVLASIREKDSYGYQMIKDIAGSIEISESTLYPILRRLEESGRVEPYSVEHNGRLRKYFHLTEAGSAHLESFARDREELLRAMDFIMGEEKRDV